MGILKDDIDHQNDKWGVAFLSKNWDILPYFVLLAAERFLKSF